MNNNLDSLGVERALGMFTKQISECFSQSYSKDYKNYSPKALIVTGMGGSSNAAKLLQGVYESKLSIPFVVHNDYSLPSWVNAETLVVANSYSGNTEETLSGYEEAQKKGAQAIGISTGGKISDVVVDPKGTNPTNFPKTGLGVSLGALAGVLAKIGVIPLTTEELDKTLAELTQTASSWDPKTIAEWFNGFAPVLFTGRPLVGALNAGRNALCEISRNFTQFYDFPEVNHVLIEALQKPESVLKNRYLFFESTFVNDRVKTRFTITKEILDQMRLEHKSYELKSKTVLGQAIELAYFCAWIGFHLSLLQNTDPGPEPWIIKLKASLSQPTH